MGLILLCFVVAVSAAFEIDPSFFPPASEVKVTLCEDAFDLREQDNSTTIYFITPTYARREQVAELTRLSNTLLSVPDLAWVVAEDSEECTQEVADLLRRYSGRGGGGYAHLAAPMPSLYRGRFYLPRGVAGRNAGAQFVVDRTAATDDDDDGDGGGDGVIFFGDDDNVYHLDLFEEIRRTRRVGMLPVGLLPKQSVVSPIVRRGHQLVGFTNSWVAERAFPVDMAGFAVSVGALRAGASDGRVNGSSVPMMPYKAGHEEDLFLRAVGVPPGEVEPLADGCTRILSWHTQTTHGDTLKFRRRGEGAKVAGTSLDRLLDLLESQGAAEETMRKTMADELETCFGSQCGGGSFDLKAMLRL